MLLILGYLIVLGSTLGGFIIAGGNPMLLLHVSEFVIIGGIALGVLVVAAPKEVMGTLMKDLTAAMGSGGASKDDFIDLFKILYELFIMGRRNGLIALDEHVTEPAKSSVFAKYPKFAGDPHKLEFLCNALRPIIDGKIKPDQLEEILEGEIESKEHEAKGPIDILTLVGDSLPGIGIIAAVLGIINTMTAISDGPEAVGYKVSAALTGTFLGILGAYGFINPLTKRISFNHKGHFAYYNAMAKSIAGFAKGLSPIMAIELARRSLDSSVQPEGGELEKTLKAAVSAKK